MFLHVIFFIRFDECSSNPCFNGGKRVLIKLTDMIVTASLDTQTFTAKQVGSNSGGWKKWSIDHIFH